MPDFKITFQNRPMSAYHDSECKDFVPFVQVGKDIDQLWLAPSELRELADELESWQRHEVAKRLTREGKA